MLQNELTFFLTQTSQDLRAPIDAKVKGDAKGVIRMMCRAMDMDDVVRDAILSAAATYLREHDNQVMNFKMTAGI